MKVGDLVKYDGGDFELFLDWVGLVINVNPGIARYARIKWNRQDGITSEHPVGALRVIT
jgi:hypothetical protein